MGFLLCLLAVVFSLWEQDIYIYKSLCYRNRKHKLTNGLLRLKVNSYSYLHILVPGTICSYLLEIQCQINIDLVVNCISLRVKSNPEDIISRLKPLFTLQKFPHHYIWKLLGSVIHNKTSEFHDLMYIIKIQLNQCVILNFF